MLRAVATLGSTAAGLAVLLAFKTHAPAAATADGAATAPTSVVTPTTAGTGMPAAAGSGPAPMGGTGPGTASAPATRVVTGSVVTTRYGPMQVQLTLAGQRITKVTVLRQTDDGSESAQLDATAIPRLTSETLAAQNAHIDAVSGASYTSEGYIRSLQNALDQA
jgi:uncharacterized protein with FMN-binding domain